MVRDQVFTPVAYPELPPGVYYWQCQDRLSSAQDVGNDLTGGFPGVSQAGNKIYAQWSETAFSAISRRVLISSVVI